MIKVAVRTDGITVDDHAEYAETGKDIICAAVSVLVQGLIDSLESLTSDDIFWHISDGYVDIRYENLSEGGKLLVDSFFIVVCDIVNAYGSEYVQIA